MGDQYPGVGHWYHDALALRSGISGRDLTFGADVLFVKYLDVGGRQMDDAVARTGMAYGGITPIGPLVREGMSAVARRTVGPIVREQKPDVVLQLTGWYRPAVPDVMRASYHDGNLASYLEWPDLLVDRRRFAPSDRLDGLCDRRPILRHVFLRAPPQHRH